MKFSPKEFISHIPFKTGILAGVLCFLVVEKRTDGKLGIHLASAEDVSSFKVEFYPLSAFPMYAQFSDEPIYNFITDDHDQPIPFATLTSEGISVLKKDYYGSLKQVRKARNIKGDIADSPLEIKQEAAKMALANLLHVRAAGDWAAKNPNVVLRLHEAVIRRDPSGPGINTTTVMLAEASASATTTTTTTVEIPTLPPSSTNEPVEP